MPRYKPAIENDDGWCDWIYPDPNGYKMACCDCGLVHNLEFAVFEEGESAKAGTFTVIPDTSGKRVMFRASRNNRSTAMIRRHKKLKRVSDKAD